MKKLVFTTMAMCLFSFGAFAKNDKNETNIKTNEKIITAEIQDCRGRGGNCIVILTINGVTRTYKICCNDVIVVGNPPSNGN